MSLTINGTHNNNIIKRAPSFCVAAFGRYDVVFIMTLLLYVWTKTETITIIIVSVVRTNELNPTLYIIYVIMFTIMRLLSVHVHIPKSQKFYDSSRTFLLLLLIRHRFYYYY